MRTARMEALPVAQAQLVIKVTSFCWIGTFKSTV